MINEIPLRHVQGDLPVGRALFENFEIIHHVVGTLVTWRCARVSRGLRRPRRCGGIYRGLLACEASRSDNLVRRISDGHVRVGSERDRGPHVGRAAPTLLASDARI